MGLSTAPSIIAWLAAIMPMGVKAVSFLKINFINPYISGENFTINISETKLKHDANNRMLFSFRQVKHKAGWKEESNTDMAGKKTGNFEKRRAETWQNPNW